MNQLDVIYRALTDYRKQTIDDRDCKLLRKAIVSACPESDRISSIRTCCTIDEDWIIAIENGLVFIEKAINEARQHIHTKGEVVPIEKAKRVSKDSVKHLAKHSDLITKQQSTDILIPDKLYIVERLSDFAVYENRFLHMLLSYLRDFVSAKYSKIVELSNTYRCNVTMNKTVSMNKRKLVFELKMTDERHDDPYLRDNNSLQPILERIENLLKTVMHLLATPLIQEVAKSPILKPPITKTNVLKMNQNFKGAVALYDFVAAYDKQGYVAAECVEHINPFPDDTAEEFAEIVSLTSFLTYKNGLGLNNFLKNSYEKEDARRREIDMLQLKEQLSQLKNRIVQSNCSPMEYILLLEKQNKSLERDKIQLDGEKKRVEALQNEAIGFRHDIQLLSATVEDKQTEIMMLNQKFSEETNRLISEHRDGIDALNEGHAAETNTLNERHAEENNTRISEHKQTVMELNEAHLAESVRKDNMILDLQLKSHEDVNRLEELNAQKSLECDLLADAKTLSDARVNALRKEYNLIAADEDFTAKVSFNELEHQYKVFKAFFKDEWKKAKKLIRKNILNSEPKTLENKDKTD